MKYIRFILLCNSLFLPGAIATSAGQFHPSNFMDQEPESIVMDTISNSFPFQKQIVINEEGDTTFIEPSETAPTVRYIYTPYRDGETGERSHIIVGEQMPQFPGGAEGLKKYLAENVRYPQRAHQEGVEGRVVAQVTIESNGRPTDVVIVEKLHFDLDKEVIRILSQMPDWIASNSRHRPLKVRLTIPVQFRLQKETNEENDPTSSSGESEK